MERHFPSKGAKDKGIYLFLCFVLFFSVFRVIHLSADPPDNLSPTSCGEYGDPGNYAFNARNKVLFGQWSVDNFNVMYLSPIPHLFTYLAFRCFGPGIWQMNLVPFFFSLLIFCVLYFLSAQYFRESRWLFFWLLAVNYPFGMYGRIANRIMPMTFFVLLAIFFFLKGWEKPKYFFLSSLFLGCSFLSKGKIIYFPVVVVPLSFFLILVQRGELFQFKLNLKRLAFFLAGGLCLAVPWYLFLYAPHQTWFKDFATINADAMFPSRISRGLGNWFLRPSFSFYPSNRLLTPLLFLYFFSLLLVLTNKRQGKKISSLEVVCSSWLVVGLVTNSWIGYRPIRHYIELSIPLLILVAIFLTRLASRFRLPLEFSRRKTFAFLLFLLVWVALTSYGRYFFSPEDAFRHPYRLALITGLISFLLTVLACFLFFRSAQGKEIALPKRIAVGGVIFFVVIYSFQNLKDSIIWFQRASFNLKVISRDLGKAFPTAVFCGLLAPSISLENRNRAHTSWENFVNYERDFLKKKKVTHLFLGTYNQEPAYYQKHFPEEWERASLLVRYRIWRSWFLLYEIQAQACPSPDSFSYEAEKMEREIGLPLFDNQASQRFSVFVKSGQRGLVAREKIVVGEPRRVSAILLVRPDQMVKDGPVVFLTVQRNGAIVSKRTLFFSRPLEDSLPGFQALSFRVFLPQPGEYDFLIHSTGNFSFFLDKMELSYGVLQEAEEGALGKK